LVALEGGVDALDGRDADPRGGVDGVGGEVLDDVLGGELALGVGDDELVELKLSLLAEV